MFNLLLVSNYHQSFRRKDPMSPRGLRQFVRGIAQLILPNTCLLCDEAESETASLRHGLCNSCVRAVSPEEDLACPRCAMTIGPHTDVSKGCNVCRGEPLGFESAIRLGPYEGKLREAILKLKSSAGEGLGEMLGRLFLERTVGSLRAAAI